MTPAESPAFCPECGTAPCSHPDLLVRVDVGLALAIVTALGVTVGVLLALLVLGVTR